MDMLKEHIMYMYMGGSRGRGYGGPNKVTISKNLVFKDEFPAASRNVPTLMVLVLNKGLYIMLFHCFFSFSFGSFRVKLKSTGLI
jgi:hypothetical protein